jgi:hypothetical protein
MSQILYRCRTIRIPIYTISLKDMSNAVDRRQSFVQGAVTANGTTAACNSRQPQGRHAGQAQMVSAASNMSDATYVSQMSCVDLPCRMDLSHVVASFSTSAGEAVDHNSRSKGQRKRPRAPETTCFRYGNYHRCAPLSWAMWDSSKELLCCSDAAAWLYRTLRLLQVLWISPR